MFRKFISTFSLAVAAAAFCFLSADQANAQCKGGGVVVTKSVGFGGGGFNSFGGGFNSFGGGFNSFGGGFNSFGGGFNSFGGGFPQPSFNSFNSFGGGFNKGLRLSPCGRFYY